MKLMRKSSSYFEPIKNPFPLGTPLNLYMGMLGAYGWFLTESSLKVCGFLAGLAYRSGSFSILVSFCQFLPPNSLKFINILVFFGNLIIVVSLMSPKMIINLRILKNVSHINGWFPYFWAEHTHHITYQLPPGPFST